MDEEKRAALEKVLAQIRACKSINWRVLHLHNSVQLEALEDACVLALEQ